MKFSYSWLKDYIPRLPPKHNVVEALNLYSFETENEGGDTMEISLPPNRYDASGHIGIARELAACLEHSRGASQKLTLQLSKPKKVKRLKQGWFPVKVFATDECSRYVALFVDGVTVQPSPSWMQKRFAACGVRSINNVVDVMNYVMLETGQPLHAFDADVIGAARSNAEKRGYDAEQRGKKQVNFSTSSKNKVGIYIRRADRGEKVTTLDNQELLLDENVLVITDAPGGQTSLKGSDPQNINSGSVLAVAGIKGGKRAEVNANTKKIVIESANFDPVLTYRATKQLNLRTDASDRFSRGISPAGCAQAAERAYELLQKIGAAKTAVGMVDIGKKKRFQEEMNVPLEWLESFLGMPMEAKEVAHVLKALGFGVRYLKGRPPTGSATPRKSTSLRVVAPSWRTDIEHREDVAEEIARIYGYNTIASRAPTVAMKGQKNPEDILKEKIRDTLVSLGVSESYGYSFFNEAQEWNKKRTPLALKNPISEAFTHLRTDLYPHLVKNAAENLRFYKDIRIFEIGTIWPAAKKTPKTLQDASETAALGIVMSRRTNDSRTLFYELKGVVERLLEHTGVLDVSLDEPSEEKLFVAGQNAKVKISENTVGHLGIVFDKIFEYPMAYAEVRLTQLARMVEEEREYEPIPRFPSVERDIAMYVDASVRIADAEQTIYNAGAKLVASVAPIDVYEDSRDPVARKSLAFRIVFQADDRTLFDEEVNREMKKVSAALEELLNAEIR